MSVQPKPPRFVKDIMTADPICVTCDTTARELARLLEANEISGVPVVDSIDRVIGVVSKTDLLRRCVEGPLGSHPGSPASLGAGLADGTNPDSDDLGTVEDFLTPDPVTATPDEPVGVVAHRMANERVHRVVVINEHMHVVGIVTSLDLLKAVPMDEPGAKRSAA